MYKKILAIFSLALALTASPARAQNVSPDDVMYITPYLLSLPGDSKGALDAQLVSLRTRLGSDGPYVKLGFAAYVGIEMTDWTIDPSNTTAVKAALASTIAQIDNIIAKAQASNFPVAIAFQTAIRERYDPAQTASENEDVRSMMWYSDNAIAPSWWTHTRYARKQQALQQAYIRELGKVVADRMRRFPDTLIAASGDGEQELATARNCALPSPNCLFSDYSPFAVAEFRDWLRNGGLYATGQSFAGQGYSLAARYAGDATPAVDTNGDGHTLNGDFLTSFASWDLKHFDWKLTDAFMASDPKALPKASFATPGLTTQIISGGFDPPRIPKTTLNGLLDATDPWWNLWVLYKQTMLQRHNIEFARWMTTSPDSTGATVPATKWYSNQIPADYAFGSSPTAPNLRWYGAMSSLFTADISPYGGLGITSFNLDFSAPCGYVDQYPGPPVCSVARTLAGAAPAIGARNVRWGLIEWNAGLVPGDTPSPRLDLFETDMALIEKYWPRLVQPFYWGSTTQDNKIEGTQFELSLKSMIARIKNGRPSVPTVKSDLADSSSVSPPFNLTGYAIDTGKYPASSGGAGIDRVEYSIETSAGAVVVAQQVATYGTNRTDVIASHGLQFAPSGFSITIPKLAAGGYVVRILTRSTVAGQTTALLTKSIPITVAYPLTVAPAALKFGATKGALTGTINASSPPQVLTPGYAGSATPVWTAAASQPWLQVTSGPNKGQFTIGVVPGNVSLSVATQTASVVLTETSAPGVSITVPVTLTIITDTASPLPFGSFDTPIDGATGLSGSVAVSGWALDDLGVDRVEIWRDRLAGETTPLFQGPTGHLGNGKIYIANAAFIDNARPDITALYSGAPRAYRAGWGYLMLTQGLFNTGNGTFKFYAFAYDVDGRGASLGSKTVTINNATAVKPFGNIDTPSNGETVTGDFWNFGWALTPPATAACTIVNGNVFQAIDSGVLTPVLYGDLRADIQSAFPTHTNANGAGGAFRVVTSGLSAGTHQIGWYVVDNCNRSEGIGSRFFNVVTGAGAEPTPTAALGPAATTATVTRDPVEVRGDGGRSESSHPNADGVRVVQVQQTERVEVILPAIELARYDAYQVVKGERRALPIGSSFDPITGTFYWQPAPGFLGSFDLEFVTGDAATRVRAVVGPANRLVVDTPAAGSTVDRAFTIAGWALDLGAADGTGVDAIDVWAYPVGVVNAKPIFGGSASYGGNRPDVGALYGPTFNASGYDVGVNGMPPGTYDLVIYARSAATGKFDSTQTVRVTVR